MENLDQIKALAALKKMKLSDVASAAGITYQQLNRIIRTGSTSLDTLEKIASALSLPASHFLSASHSSQKADVEQKNCGNSNGDHSTQVVGDNNAVGGSALEKALDEIAEQRKLVAKAQEHVDRLLALLEGRVNGNA